MSHRNFTPETMPAWHEVGGGVAAMTVPGRLLRFAEENLPDILGADRETLLDSAAVPRQSYGETSMGKKI